MIISIKVLRLHRWADASILQGLPTRLGWPLLLTRRPLALAVHHNSPSRHEAAFGGLLRSCLSQRTRHAAVSRALANELPWPVADILPNPYDDLVFRSIGSTRDRHIIFVGRLIPEKGVQVLIEALTILRRAGQPLTATIVGDGEERDSLEQLAKRNHLEQCLLFTGAVTGGALAGLLNRHRLMVVPSTYHEPFGIVALEGIACGCVVIGSQAGGLPEAIGPCGTTVRPANPALLAAEIRDVLAGRRELAGFPKLAEAHLAAHRAEAVASRYLELLRRLAQPALSARKAETSRRPNFENVSRA